MYQLLEVDEEEYLEEEEDPIFDLATVLPTQWFAKKNPETPEGLLYLAMLDRAILDIRGDNLLDRSHALLWISSNDRTWIFSFRAVCEYFDLNPEWIRDGLMRCTNEKTLPAIKRQYRRRKGVQSQRCRQPESKL